MDAVVAFTNIPPLEIVNVALLPTNPMKIEELLLKRELLPVTNTESLEELPK
jgi:hypothetical protein